MFRLSLLVRCRESLVARNRVALYCVVATAKEASSATDSVNKEVLIRMRKETGYSYAKCRNALKTFGEQNFDDAKRWLKEMAVKEGWEKAEKLGTRVTSQGLLGLIAQGNLAAVVELRCETDFVSRSHEFKNTIDEITLALFDHGITLQKLMPTEGDKLHVVEIDPSGIKTKQGRTVDETIAMTIGQLKENIFLSKCLLYFAREGLQVFGHAHPMERHENSIMGRFVSFVGIEQSAQETTEKLAGQICQHIIGMAPTELGQPFNEEERARIVADAQRREKEMGEEEQNRSDEERLNAFERTEAAQIDENETALLRQSFMLNPSETVDDYLKRHEARITDFVRFELGKSDDVNKNRTD